MYLLTGMESMPTWPWLPKIRGRSLWRSQEGFLLADEGEPLTDPIHETE
jgi:hypothetical protein